MCILVPSGTVTVFNIAPTATPMQLAEQFAMYGDIKDVREDPQIQGCWLLEYYDIRHAAAAYKALNRSSHMHATLPVVSESTPSQGPQQMASATLRNAPQQPGMRNVQSSHVLNNLGSEFGAVGGEDAWQGSRSWDNKTGAAFQEQLASLMYNRQNGKQTCTPVLLIIVFTSCCTCSIWHGLMIARQCCTMSTLTEVSC